MTDYNKAITSADLSAAMQEPEVYKPIFKSAIEASAALTNARPLQPMSRNTRTMTIMDSFPVAYWQATGTTLKKTTEMAWKGKTLTAEEMAVIVPIAEDLLADTANTGYDIWGEITPMVGQAMARLIDLAVFTGSGLPATWMTTTAGVSQDLLTGATAASMTVVKDTGVDLYDDILGEDGIVSLVEQQGFEASGHVAPVAFKGQLRHVREDRTATGAGQPLLVREGGGYTLDMVPVQFVKNAAIAPTTALLYSGDWDQLVYAIRQDITVKLLDQGVIQDANGTIVYNLAQQDMVALRFVFRLGFQIANPVTLLSQTEATRYPFAVLTPAAT